MIALAYLAGLGWLAVVLLAAGASGLVGYVAGYCRGRAGVRQWRKEMAHRPYPPQAPPD